jgi:hypothetical protein
MRQQEIEQRTESSSEKGVKGAVFGVAPSFS